MFIAAALALAGAADLLRLPSGSAPVRIALVIVALAVGVGVTMVLNRADARPYWQLSLFAALILMPVVSLQASASRVPFVALARGSAGPLLWFTAASCVILLGLWLLATYQSGEEPENAALLFLPAAVLVPAMLGAASGLDESAALAMLGEANLLAGVAIFIGLLSPVNWRPAAGGVALGAQFLVLWALGRGPVLGRVGGFVVPASAAILLTLTVMLTVLAPLGALFSRRFLQTVDEEFGEAKPASVPARGAHRRADP
jgi:hypothetical protein